MPPITHKDLIEFQYNLLKRLASGENTSTIAAESRNFIKNLYSNGYTPNGAEVGINVNNECNLKCKHCYYANTHLRREGNKGILSGKEWKKVVGEAVALGFDHINIVGKEPLLNPEETKAILSAIKNHQNKGKRIRYELLTNGILIPEEIKWLKKFKDFYFFSISFDGTQKYHDAIRGEGSYQKAREGLRVAHQNGIKNLSATFCAMPNNVKSLNKMLNDLTPLGLEYLSIGLCFPTEYNEKGVHAGLPVFEELLSQVKNAPENLDISISIMVEEHPQLIAELYKRGYISKKRLAVTEDFGPSLIIPINKKPRTAIHLSILPTMFFSGFRIDYDGSAIDFCAALESEDRKSFGNARQEPISELYKKSRGLWSNYSKYFYQRLSDAFQGKKVKPLKPAY